MPNTSQRIHSLKSSFAQDVLVLHQFDEQPKAKIISKQRISNNKFHHKLDNSVLLDLLPYSFVGNSDSQP